MMKQYKKLLALLTLLCFALTFMPVAAFAAVPEGIDYQESTVFTDDKDASEKTGKDLTIQFDFQTIGGKTEAQITTNVYVWFVKSGSNVAATGVAKGANAASNVSGPDANGVFTIENAKSGADYDFRFSNSGTYTVRAAFDNPSALYPGKTLSECFSDVEYKLGTVSGQNSFEITSSSDSDLYTIQIVGPDSLEIAGKKVTLNEGEANAVIIDNAIPNNGQATVGAGGNASAAVNKHLQANGVASDDITFKLLDKDGKAVKGATVELSTNSPHCIVNKETITTDSLGQFKFTLTLTAEAPNTDNYSVFIDCGSYSSTLIVSASGTAAYDVFFTKLPSGPISTDDATQGSALDDYIYVQLRDVNGNVTMPYSLQAGGKNEEPAFAGVYVDAGGNASVRDYKDSKWGESAENYVSIVSQPAGSTLEDEDCWLRPVGPDAGFQCTMYFEEDLIAGDYTFKIALQNGNSKNISFTVAEMGEPVALTVEPKAAVVELGSKTYANVKLVDANGVKCDATKKGTDISASGYAVAKAEVVSEDSNIDIWLKPDDKYLNSEIKVVAVNDRYNLTGEATINVTSGNTVMMPFVTEAKINTPTDLAYAVMDVEKQGVLAITNGNDADTMAAYVPGYEPQPGDFKLDAGHIGFIVVAKPEGATVHFAARAAGGAPGGMIQDVYGQSRIECDKPGVVTVKYTLGLQLYTTEGTWTTRYYEGTQNIVFSDGSIGKTVVMSIGSSEIVVDGEKANIDAAPIVQNSRTYVPFRALAEAFGAEVAYDEATQAVTATLGSNTVVMTIGSATYTVNGEEKTADVAPFISGGRTMVPVRFAAEAFGSTVIPTYDDNGATADVLFKL